MNDWPSNNPFLLLIQNIITLHQISVDSYPKANLHCQICWPPITTSISIILCHHRSSQTHGPKSPASNPRKPQTHRILPTILLLAKSTTHSLASCSMTTPSHPPTPTLSQPASSTHLPHTSPSPVPCHASKLASAKGNVCSPRLVFFFCSVRSLKACLIPHSYFPIASPQVDNQFVVHQQ